MKNHLQIINALETERAKRLTPRAYQSELFALAQKSNVIIRGDTGTGKTYVAAMVIKALLSQPIAPDEPHKVIVFFAPKVALATQQYGVLRAQLPEARVKLYYGDMTDIDNWRDAHWKAELEVADVVVCTPQIFLDVLRHGFWPMSRISLLIFDEAHHGTKRNAYNLIMAEHYFDIIASKRPRVLGMTASPVYESRKAIQAINMLESNLDARLVEVQENIAELASIARRPTEIVVMYSPPPLEMHQSAMEIALYNSAAVDLVDDIFRRQLDNIRAALGPLGGDYFIVDFVRAHIKRARRSTAEKSGFAIDPALLGEYERVINEELEPLALAQKPEGEAISNKVATLFECIDRFQSPDFIAVVFVQQRTHCAAIMRMLARCDLLAHFIKPVCLMGHGGRAGATGGMPVVNQARVVNQLRSGEANVLVATQVAEEGMDFPACSLCIRFDLPQTLVSFIQSRGRARAANATFVSLCLENTTEAENATAWAAQEEQQRHHLRNRDVDDGPDEPDLESTPRFQLESGAVLTHASAVSLLNMVCSLLPHESYELRPKPEFLTYQVGRHFVADVILPIMPRLPDTERKISGAPAASKMGARRAVAFKACMSLHDRGILDSHLLPERPGQAEANLYADNTEVDRKPVVAEYAVTVPNVFGPLVKPDCELWFHRIRFSSKDGTANDTIGFICAAPLVMDEPIKLFGTPSKFPSWTMTFAAPPEQLFWDQARREDQLEKLYAFNKFVVVSVLNRFFSTAHSLLHLLAPLTPDGDIDWQAVAKPTQPLTREEIVPGAFVVVATGSTRDSRLFHVERYCTELTVNSPITPLETADGIQPASKAAVHFGTYALYLTGVHRVPPELLPPDEPMILLSAPPAPRNMLCPWYKTEDDVEPPAKFIARRRVMPLCVLHSSLLPLSFWAIARGMASWTRAINDRMRLAMSKLALDLPRGIPDALLMQALTLPQCQVGYDYETLETVGDTFLKLCTTVHLVIQYPDKLEGALTALKHNSTDNLFLRKRGLAINLGSHIISERFQNTGWVPPSILNAKLSRDGLTIQRVVKRRVFSDCCEALLGAAWMGIGVKEGTVAGIAAVLRVGEIIGVHFGGTTPWPDRMPPMGQGASAPHTLQPIERQIGYTFKDARWLLRAITHRTIAAGHGAYEVVEYLGDAIVDAWIVRHITLRFPHITAEGLSRFKSSLASNGALGYLSLRYLDLPRHLLHSAPLLPAAMAEAMTEIAQVPPEELFGCIPFLEPPKVAADLVEALCGAVFLDARCDLDTVFAVCDRIFAPLIPLLTAAGPPVDPISALRQACDKRRCREVVNAIAERVEGAPYIATVTQHGRVLGHGSHRRAALAARQLAAHEALPKLSLEGCDCPKDAFPVHDELDSDADEPEEDEESEVDSDDAYVPEDSDDDAA